MTRLQDWWLSRFDRSRFDVALCAMKHPEPGSVYLQERGHTVHYLRCRRIDPRAFWRLASLCRELGVDLLHVHQYAASNFGRMVARYLRLPLVLHDHMTDPSIPGYQVVADRLLRGLTTEAIAVSRATRDFMIAQRSVPAERIHVVTNGVPIRDFLAPPPGTAESTRREFGIPLDAMLIGAVGRLAPQKGYRHLIESAEVVLRRYPAARLMIAGDGHDFEALRAQADGTGVGDRIIMPGHRWDVSNLLAAFDVFALPSLFEGTPLTLIEAMAAGKAIVSTSVDGCGEILHDRTTAIVIEPGNSTQLTNGLLTLAADPALRSRLGRAASVTAARDLDIDRCVEAIEAIYERLLRSSSRWRSD
jgi:glycosyltransferase involved in cell wall biosynthesis